MIRRHPLPILFLAAALVGTGCYTMLRHPVVDQLADDDGTSRACVDCHAEADLYHEIGVYDYHWYRFYPAPWAAYYEPPWWYDDYWFSQGPSQPGMPVETRERHLWSREGSSGPGFLPVQGDKAIGGTGKPTGPGAPPPPPREGDDDDEKKEKKEKRHLWGR